MKYVRLDEVQSQPGLLSMWAKGRLERQAAHEQAKAVAAAVENVTGEPVTTWKPPADWILRPVRAGERRVTTKSGVSFVVVQDDDDSSVSTKHVVVPPSALHRSSFAVMTHIVGRCSVGASSLYWLSWLGYIMVPFWDYFHGQWRSVKGSAESLRWMWSSIRQIVPVVNLNYGLALPDVPPNCIDQVLENLQAP